MTEQRERGGFGPNDGDAARDLRNTLLVGALTVLVFGTMVLATESGTGVLQIPTLETALLAAWSIFFMRRTSATETVY